MKLTETLTPDAVAETLRRELPGFENQILIEERTFMLTLEVRGPVWFGGREDIDHHLTFPLATNEHNEVYQQHIEELIRQTRADAINRLGLDKEIDQQVEEKTRKAVAEAKAKWEQEAYERGFNAAYTMAARAVAEGLAIGLQEREI